VVGVESNSPEALLFEPINENDEGQQGYGEFVTRAYEWAIVKGNGHFERSRAFEDLICTGVGWLDYYVDTHRDPRGLPKQVRIPYDEMWWPQCPNQNLDGTRWRARESLIDKEEALDRWPDDAMIIRAAMTTAGNISDRPEANKTVVYTIPYIETKPIEHSESDDPGRGKVKILQWQWFEDQPGYYFYDPLEQDDIWMKDEDFRQYRTRLQKVMQQEITDYIRQSHRLYQQVFLLNAKHQLGEPINIAGDRFTFNPMTGHYDEEDKIWYGFEKVLMDPQRYANKFFNQTIEIMGHQAKGGGLYEEGAINPKQVDLFKKNYAKPGTWNEVSDLAISGGKLKEKNLPQLPAASMTIMEFCVKVMENVTGIDPVTAMGGSTGQMPGVSLKQQQKSGLLLLAQEFRSLSRFRIEEGHIIFQHLKLLADGRLIRLGEPFDSQVVQLMEEPYALDYELMLDDTERDPNIRKMYAESVMSLAPTLIRMNKFLPELLDYFPLPVRFRQKLKESIKAQEKKEIEMSKSGVARGGRASPVTPEERQAKVAKIQADTKVSMARAARIEGQKERDQLKIILEALVAANNAETNNQRLKTELQEKVMDIVSAQDIEGSKERSASDIEDKRERSAETIESRRASSRRG